MSVSLQQIAAGIKERLDTIPGLHAEDHAVAAPNFPAAMFVVPPIDYRLAMKADVAVVSIPAEIHVMVSHSSGHQAQKTKLWPYLDWTGSESILLAINADKTLGISDKVNANVMSCRGLTLEEVGTLQAFGAAIELSILITNRE